MNVHERMAFLKYARAKQDKPQITSEINCISMFTILTER